MQYLFGYKVQYLWNDSNYSKPYIYIPIWAIWLILSKNPKKSFEKCFNPICTGTDLTTQRKRPRAGGAGGQPRCRRAAEEKRGEV